MTWRAGVRALRLYYKSFGLFWRELNNYQAALWLPFAKEGVFYPRNLPQPIFLPRGHWSMLPTVCRLLEMGAVPSWVDGKLKITFKEWRFYAPPLVKATAAYLKDIFVEDVYRLEGSDLCGRTVLDVGAYIGDSSIAFASRGAKVHAFEPAPGLVEFLRLNVAANGMQDRITIHSVGLSGRDEVRTSGDREIRLVHALSYLKGQAIGPVDWLKLDCEGCEYELFYKLEFLQYLRPRRIILEYHDGGGSGLTEWLTDQGYEVDWPEPRGYVGYLYAERREKAGTAFSEELS